MIDINPLLEIQTNLPKAKCLIYEPLSVTEGMCYDGSVVNINCGCQNPETCDRYKIGTNLKKIKW